MLKFPENLTTKEARIEWLVKNKSLIIDQKKSAIKHADPVYCRSTAAGEVQKDVITTNKIKIRAVVNTTRYFDSHFDVHIDQLWNKSIKETRTNYLVREHRLDFDNIISDDVHVFVKQIPWRELGYDAPGTTQALIYDAVIERGNSAGMFDKYIAGKVRNHSVGMRYVKVYLAVNDPQYEEYKYWEKYAPEIVNLQEAEENGFFFAVTEAKNIEGSAVVVGSNPITPTLRIEEKGEPQVHSPEEPIDITLISKMYNPLIIKR